ncbi:MAG: hypothetical protein H7A34_01660, partial [bacterium]|nr:hypothetical protein [bacterium]
IGGFNNYKQTTYYKQAYEKILNDPSMKFICILDKDYYNKHDQYAVNKYLSAINIKCIFTAGKELVNFFLNYNFYTSLLKNNPNLEPFWDDLFKMDGALFEESFATYFTFYQEQHKGLAPGTAYKKAKELFKYEWEKEPTKIVHGKNAFKAIKEWLHSEFRMNIYNSHLVKWLSRNDKEFISWTKKIMDM